MQKDLKDFKILNNINSPEDLKKLNISELADLSEDIREFLIWNISRTGGHLGSNLGIVELTVALHYIFDSPNDKIIWDVGHQSYAHKILTGRKNRFSELRKYGGLSGFTKISESIHDPFGAGHSSTALSAAIGIARANILDKKYEKTVAVVGDGSFTGGLVYEALNNSKNCENLIVILNDNEMSISKNVGTMVDYLANIRTTKKYYSFRHRTKNFFSAIPLFGKLFLKLSQIIARLFRRSLYNATFFEQVGFDFLGPVDGHEINKLLAVLNEAKTRKNPVFIHVKTQKGRGYEKAESSSVEYHSVGQFDVDEGLKEIGEDEKTGYSFSSNFGNKICETAETNKKICAVTAAMAEGTGLAPFREKYPERFFDVGIAEEHAAVFSAGLAVGGYIPIFAVYSSFFQRSYDQVLHDIALQNLHVILCVDRAGLVGEDGVTHHGIFDAAFLNHIPNITVFSPSSYKEFNESFDFAVNEINAPVAIRYPKGGQDENFNKKLLDFNTENNLNYIYIKNPDAKYLVISYGRISKIAFEVYEKLGCAEFIKLNKIKPLDYIYPEILKSDAENIILIEEGIETGGISEIIAAHLSKYNSGKTVKIFAVNDFVEHGTTEQLFEVCGLDAEKIYSKIINRQTARKLLLFDLDDTLLTSEKTITPYSVEAIKSCKAKGMVIGYITGRARPFKDEVFFTDKYNLPCDFIAHYNGAEIYAGGVLIESNVIPCDNAMKIIRGLSEAYPNAKIGVMHEPWSYNSKSGENWNMLTGEKVKCSISELPCHDVQRIRIVFRDNDDKNKLNEFMTEETIFFITSDGTAMIVNKQAAKEHALEKASEYFNIPFDDIIAFGDDINDINMLKTAGIGVVMDNAGDHVKEIADFVTESNDNEGISIWINKYLLKK